MTLVEEFLLKCIMPQLDVYVLLSYADIIAIIKFIFFFQILRTCEIELKS